MIVDILIKKNYYLCIKKIIMADNYLENRYNQLFNQKKTIKKIGQSFDTLLLKSKNNNSFTSNVLASSLVLNRIVGANDKIDYFCIKELFEFFVFIQTEPMIIVCKKDSNAQNLEIALGFSLQTMILKATEIGFAANLILDFNKNQITNLYNLTNNPLAIIKIGKLS